MAIGRYNLGESLLPLLQKPLVAFPFFKHWGNFPYNNIRLIKFVICTIIELIIFLQPNLIDQKYHHSKSYSVAEQYIVTVLTAIGYFDCLTILTSRIDWEHVGDWLRKLRNCVYNV